MKKPIPKMLFVVRSYVWATNAQEALKIAAKEPPHEAWVDDEFRKRMADPKDLIGYSK